MSEAMKPCPFCGGEAKIYTPPITLGDDDADVDYMRPVCTSCGVVGQLVRLRDHNRRSASYQGALSEATAAWNTRRTESPLGPVADELERRAELAAQCVSRDDDDFAFECGRESALREAAARITALEAMCEKMAEELPFAIAKALYGPGFDPSQNPEAFDFCGTVARKTLAQYREADNGR